MAKPLERRACSTSVGRVARISKASRSAAGLHDPCFLSDEVYVVSELKQQFGLHWLFAAISLLAVVFAVIATNGGALMAVVVMGTLTPALVLLWIISYWLRDKIFGLKPEPLASSLRDPLGFNDDQRHQNKSQRSELDSKLGEHDACQ